MYWRLMSIISRTRTKDRRNNRANDPAAVHDNHWYRQPVAWLGILITVVLIVACIWTVMISRRYTYVPVGDPDVPTFLGVPMPSLKPGNDRSP